MTSYRAFQKLHNYLPADGATGHGIRPRVANFFFDKPVEQNAEEYEKMLEIEAAKVCPSLMSSPAELTTVQLPGYERDPLLVTKHAVSQQAGVVDAYKHVSPVIDTDAYMLWLRSVVEAKGGKLVTEHVSGDLLEQEDELLQAFDAQYIVNATGLGAFEAAGDKTVYPLRGALIRVVNDGTKFPKVTEALVVANDYAKRDEDGGIVFIVPRNDKTLILGGARQLKSYCAIYS